MKYVLVLQWPTSALTFDDMIELEDKLIELIEEISPGAMIDGHDFGSGEANVFVHTDEPSKTFERLLPILQRMNRSEGIRAAYRRPDDERYCVLWPHTLKVFEVK